MKRLVILLGLLLSCIPSRIYAQIPFGIPTGYSVGGTPASIFAVDLDGDGDLDLISADGMSSDTTGISVLINNGDATFQPVVRYGVGGTSLPISIFAKDLDSDGDIDIAVANDLTYDVSILDNNGDATFQLDSAYAVGWGPCSIFIRDFDRDGDEDIVTVNRGVLESRDISVLMNNVDGTFQGADHYGVGGLSQPASVFASDLDGDTDIDFAVGNDISSNISIIPNNGDGTFTVIGRNYDVQHTPYSIFASDLDGDGDKDLATANGLLGEFGKVSVLINIGPGIFYEPVNYDIGTWYAPISIFASDLDGDGDNDLVTANNWGNNYTILENNGDGTFELFTWPLGGSPTAVCIADLDRDGDNDLAMTAFYGISLYEAVVVLNLSNPEVGAISGTITNINGANLSNATVKIFTIDDFGEYKEFAVVTTSSDGQYFVDELYPGRYSVEVYRNGYYAQTKYGIVPESGTGSLNFSLELAGFILDSNYATGDGPSSTGLSDLDGDGDIDLAVANTSSDDVSIFLNFGNGKYQEAINYPTGDAPVSLSISDFDGDGDDDIVTANGNSNNISVLFNNGNSTFQAPVNYAAGNVPWSIFASDLDGDGDNDIVVTNIYSNNVSVLKNSGGGVFQAPVNYTAGNIPQSVYACDIDGDGDNDLAVANYYSDNVSILKNNGDATFQTAINYVVGEAPWAVAGSDLDMDGDIDLVTTNANSDNVSILKNNGNGTFAAKINYSAGELPMNIFVSDLDGDGFNDLAVTTKSGTNDADSVSLLLNNGNGTFQKPINYPVGLYSNSVGAADLDDDGDQDLVISNSSSDNISVLFNQSIMTSIEFTQVEISPTDFKLLQNFPNPFNPNTKIKYSVPSQSYVTIKVFGILGDEIETLVNEVKQEGSYEVNWNAASLPSGVYFYRIQAGDFMQTKKMIILK